MKKAQAKKVDRKQSDIQIDSLIQQAKKNQVPFLYATVKDPFKKSETFQSEKKLYRVIKLK